MNIFFLVIYFVCFCLIGGGAFAMMYANITSTWKEPVVPPKPLHPEAPQPGEEVMYVDLTREKLEDLYND